MVKHTAKYFYFNGIVTFFRTHLFLKSCYVAVLNIDTVISVLRAAPVIHEICYGVKCHKMCFSCKQKYYQI